MRPYPVIAIVQARVGSERLPGKVLADLAGKPLLERVIERAAASRVDSVVIATTTHPDDDRIVALAEGRGVQVYRGSDVDVLDRMYGAALTSQAGIVVRVTADDPFKDPAVVDLVIDHVEHHPEVDYASNTLEPTFPEGLDVECFTFEALAMAWREATLPSEREHVTPFIWRRPERFTLRSVHSDVDRSAMRWTIDYPDDLEFARRVQAQLPPGDYSMEAVLKVLDSHPDLAGAAPRHERNAGYKASRRREAVETEDGA